MAGQYPKWYVPRCRECRWAVVIPDGSEWASCLKDFWEGTVSITDLMCDVDYVAPDCPDYDPMDLEPDGSPIPGADYPDRLTHGNAKGGPDER